MPPLANPSRSKADASSTVLQKATVAAGALRDVSGSSHVPFLHAISGASFAIFAIVQSFKVQKQEYVRLVQQIHDLLWAIIDLCVSLEATDLLPPSILHTIGNFARTLQKIHSFVEGQVTVGKLRRLLRTGNTQQLEQCKAELNDALEAFSVHSGIAAAEGLAKVQQDEEARHRELLALVEALSASTTSSSNFSSITRTSSGFSDSTNSLVSLLPAQPKIFHGREREVQEIVATLLQESALVAILGGGGMGKTSLATTVLHDSRIVEKFEHRYFVPCDGSTTCTDLVYVLASHLQSEPARNLIVHHLAAGPPTLLVLDNLETPWEPISSRPQVEEFLSLLTGISHLALLITMRGVERPGKVRWTRPFLAPLKPLSYEAARQTFLDIADESESNADIDELLRLTDHLPLAVSLIANIVSFEGSETVLRRWKEEHTTLLSEGLDKRSNLDMSIVMSLSSPRMLIFPGAQDLLSVISLLPDGLLEADLVHCALPIEDIEKCKVTLIRTSLAYTDRDGRIKALAPVREYVRKVHPPPRTLLQPVTNHLYDVLMLWKTFRQISAPECVPRISANLGNFQSVLLWGLMYDDEDTSLTIRRILTLDSFLRATAKGISTLREHIPELLKQCSDHQVHGEYITALFESQHYYESKEIPVEFEDKGIREFKLANDPVGEVQLYNVLATYHLFSNGDADTAGTYCNRALSLSTEIGDAIGQGKALMHLSEIHRIKGNFRLGQQYAQRAQEAFRPSGHLVAQAHAIKAEVSCTYSLSDFRRTAQLCAQAQNLLSICGLQNSSLGVSLMNAEAEAHLLKTEYTASRALQTQIMQKTSKGTEPLEYAYALLNVAGIDCATGAAESAVRQNLDMAWAIFAELKAPGAKFFCNTVTVDLQLRRGGKAEARAHYEHWFGEFRGRPDFALVCLSKLSDPAYGMHDESATFAYTLVLLGYARKSQNRVAIHHALRCIGDIFVARGDDDTGLSLITTALVGFNAMDVHQYKGDCLMRMAEICERRREIGKGAELLREARVMFERSSQAMQVSLIDSKLSTYN